MNRILDTQWSMNRLVLDNQVSAGTAESTEGETPTAYILSSLRNSNVESVNRMSAVQGETRFGDIKQESRIVYA